ncbi:MAG: pyridoxal 5'-phosphate synthase glutaminase subunit PdxT [Ilumatobacteraceae bacterium]|nr:pyridoxal 5'-phosphate synthase glutaminase subunit PdxT [Ilumatobacteraceae bacterium]
MRGLRVNKQIGILALQGAFASHASYITELGHSPQEVRTPRDLGGLDALIMPGGESSTMSQLLESSGLFEPIQAAIVGGLPTFGTCAGMILLAREIVDGRLDQCCFDAIDITVRRNAFGRQIDSFEADIDTVMGDFHGVFIRAPRIESVGEKVEVLGTYGGEPVLVRQANVLAASFHPELTGDARLHEYFINSVVTTKEK